ncbi:MAG: hypothetical protein GX248_10400 [Peptococcaceae bacterium]|nr:hypothetical protein [Peptococcaceae bacterium]
MKCSADLRNLKIISINEGKQVSTVKDIIIDPSNGSVAFFVIDQPIDYLGARIIAFEDVLGLGDYALIINDSSVIQDVAHNSLAIELLEREVKVIGSQVLTTKGGLIGQVSEFMIEEETGRIAVFNLEDEEGKSSQCPCDQVITYGRDIIMIEQGKKTAQTSNKERKQDTAVSSVNNKERLKKKIEEFGKDDSLLKTPANSSEGVEFSQDFNVFEQRQLQFLVGKVLAKDVKLETGGLLKAGEKISQESLAGVKSRQTLMQLTAHVMK